MLLDLSLLYILPECTIHCGHQLPMPALLLSRHPVTQALPPERAACRCSHQPHAASAGQGVGLELGQEGPLGCKGTLADSAMSDPLALGRPCRQATVALWHCTPQFKSILMITF